MQVKTSELTGSALNWAVAKCEGVDYSPVTTYNGIGHDFPPTVYSFDWAQGGPIIERERITFGAEGDLERPVWVASLSYSTEVRYVEGVAKRFCTMRGPTPLIAAMRCYVASKMGDIIEIPDELK